MKKQYTPGPWRAIRCTTRAGYTIAQAPIEGRALAVNIAQVGPFPREAALLAQAPNLLEALSDVITSAESAVNGRNITAETRLAECAAIARAAINRYIVAQAAIATA